MPGPPGFKRVLEWTAPGTYPTRGITCPEGTFLGQYRQVPVEAPTARYRWPLDAAVAACYRIAGNERIPDGPADALVVEDLAWWEGDLYAGGWTLDADSRGAAALWRREAEADWTLLWRGPWTAEWIGPTGAEGFRLWPGEGALYVRAPLEGATRGPAFLAYRGVMVDLQGFPWPLGRFSPWGGAVTGYVWPWLRREQRDGWDWSEVCEWRGASWVLGWRRPDYGTGILRLARFMPGDTLYPIHETTFRYDPPVNARVLIHLSASRFGLWGFVTHPPGPDYGGGLDAAQDDAWLHYDGRTMRSGTSAPRALAPLGIPAWSRQRETWIATTAAGLGFGGTHPALGTRNPHTYTLYKTPVDLCVYRVGLEWSDGSSSGGSGGNEPTVGLVSVEWAVAPGTDWNHRPQVTDVGLEWSDGSGGNAPTVGRVQVAWSDGSGGNEPTVGLVSIEWQDGPGGPGGETPNSPQVKQIGLEWSDAAPPIDPETEKVLWLVEEGETDCTALRIVVGGLTLAEQADLRVYVRTDSETLPVDAWHTYQVAALRMTVFLDEPGQVVRVGIVGPAALDRPDVAVGMVRG